MDKICPILILANPDKSYTSTEMKCLKIQCAWYNSGYSQCAIKDISDSLNSFHKEGVIFD